MNLLTALAVLSLATTPTAPAKPKADAGSTKVVAAKADAGHLDAGTHESKDAGAAKAKDAGSGSRDGGTAPIDAATSKDAGAPAKETASAKDAGTPAKEVARDAGAAAKESAPAKDAYALVPIAAPEKKIERLWKSKCSGCHGMDGKAATEKGTKMKMTDLSAPAWQTSHGNDELKKTILEGRKAVKDGVKQEMDPFKDELTPAEVDQLLLYVRWLGAPKS